MADFKGQIEVRYQDAENAGVEMSSYDGKLVLTAHSTVVQPDPEGLIRQLDRWMRDNNLSRVEAYWNAVPPEDENE